MPNLDIPSVLSSEGPTCPYCGTIITPDEGIYYDEHRLTELDCPDCEKRFDVTVVLSAHWRSRKKQPDGLSGFRDRKVCR